MLKSLSFGVVLVVVVLGVASVTGCEGRCSGNYNCPAGIPYETLSGTGLPAPLVEVSADAPCTATLTGGDGGTTSVLLVDNAFNETLTCSVHGRLADGRAVSAIVTFESATVACCPGFLAKGGAFSLTDGGADGP
jgi:hypothetical protein